MAFNDTPSAMFDLFGDSAAAPQSPTRIVAATHPLFLQRTPLMVADAEVRTALEADATSRRILAKGRSPGNGDLVGVRLNINLLKSQGVPVQTVHAGNASGGHRRNKGFFNGEVLTYRKWVQLRDAYFNVHQTGREKIATGAESKYPMASIDGEYVSANRVNMDGIEIRFNPNHEHLFTDMRGRPVRWAEEVTIYGHRAYARGMIEYYTERTAPAKVGDAPSAVAF